MIEPVAVQLATVADLTAAPKSVPDPAEAWVKPADTPPPPAPQGAEPAADTHAARPETGRRDPAAAPGAGSAAGARPAAAAARSDPAGSAGAGGGAG